MRKIKTIKVKNFRSISNAGISLDAPIITVIGPNGTGKTNLLLALKFIGNCLGHGPRRAIQMAGGLDKVFLIKERRAKSCSFSILLELDETQSNDSKFIAEYSFTLKFDDLSRTLLVSEEKLETKRNENSELSEIVFSRSQNKEISLTNFGSHYSKIDEEKEDRTIWQVESHDLAIFRMYTRFMRQSTLSKTLNPEERASLSKATNCIFQVIEALESIKGYNLDPELLRKSSDLLSSDAMAYDGRGFASLINRIFQGQFTRRLREQFRRGELDSEKFKSKYSEIYREVLSFLKEVTPNENIDNTTVELKFTEAHQEKTGRKFGTAHLSDGSLKFLALLLAVQLQDYSVMYVEELENYLNPKAIRRIIELMKNIGETTNRRFIITTHSETILNLMEPSSILISRRSDDGNTTYSSIKELKKVTAALNDSGLGLGYYWGIGGLDAF